MDSKARMTSSAKKVLRLMAAVGLPVPEAIRIQRTYAGPHQRAIGWVVWVAERLPDLRVVCGSGVPIKDLQVGNVTIYPQQSRLDAPELGPVQSNAEDVCARCRKGQSGASTG
jgi:hypothetical protein